MDHKFFLVFRALVNLFLYLEVDEWVEVKLIGCAKGRRLVRVYFYSLLVVLWNRPLNEDALHLKEGVLIREHPCSHRTHRLTLVLFIFLPNMIRACLILWLINK